jgi:L-asparaginase
LNRVHLIEPGKGGEERKDAPPSLSFGEGPFLESREGAIAGRRSGNRSEMRIKIFATGGTIDKVYFDQKSTYQVGESRIAEILREANIGFEYEFESILKKDSLDMTGEDRQLILDKVKGDSHELVIVTHGTDTMDLTARELQAIKNKVIVLTGAMRSSISASL